MTYGIWIDISNYLPKEGDGIIVTDGKIVTVASLEYLKGKPFWWSGHGFGGDEWEFEFSEVFSSNEITHWMPLPEIIGVLK